MSVLDATTLRTAQEIAAAFPQSRLETVDDASALLAIGSLLAEARVHLRDAMRVRFLVKEAQMAQHPFSVACTLLVCIVRAHRASQVVKEAMCREQRHCAEQNENAVETLCLHLLTMFDV